MKLDTTFYRYIFDPEGKSFETPDLSNSWIFKNDFKIKDTILTSLLEIDISKVARELKCGEDEALDTIKSVVKGIFRCQDWRTEPIKIGNMDILEFKVEVTYDKHLRKDLDKQLQRLKNLTPSRERSLAITKLQEAIMWLGMDLKRLNETNPYPDSYDPTNTKINPTADGLKM
jgi:hypothetical protein